MATVSLAKLEPAHKRPHRLSPQIAPLGHAIASGEANNADTIGSGDVCIPGRKATATNQRASSLRELDRVHSLSIGGGAGSLWERPRSKRRPNGVEKREAEAWLDQIGSAAPTSLLAHAGGIMPGNKNKR